MLGTASYWAIRIAKRDMDLPDFECSLHVSIEQAGEASLAGWQLRGPRPPCSYAATGQEARIPGRADGLNL